MQLRRPRGSRLVTVVVALVPVLAACTGTDNVTGQEELSKVEFVVPYDPGGGYDEYVRLIAPFLSDCLGGTDVVAVNEPGAGSLLATNKTGKAPPDGSRIQILNTVGAVSAQLAEAEGAHFDLATFTWLGRIADEPSAVLVGTDSEFGDFRELIRADRPVRFVATGPGSNEHIFATMLADVYGFDVEMVTGFAGSGEAQAAVIKGEADAHVVSVGSSLAPVDAGDLRPLAIIGSEPYEQLPDTPSVLDFPPRTGKEDVLDGLVGLVKAARAVAAPPGMDKEISRTLREGLECALTDEKLLAQAKKHQRDIAFLPGDETRDLVGKVLNAPHAVREAIAESF